MNLLDSSDFKKIVEISKKNPNCIALILFGSYAKNTSKKTSDIDLCIIRKKDSMSNEFDELNFRDEKFDIHFFDKLPDYIKYRIFSEGKVLILNDSLEFFKIRKKFLHIYRDEYPFREYRLNLMISKI